MFYSNKMVNIDFLKKFYDHTQLNGTTQKHKVPIPCNIVSYFKYTTGNTDVSFENSLCTFVRFIRV